MPAELRSLALPSKTDGTLTTPPQYLPDDQGVFYLLQLEPEHDPGRIEVGFAVSLQGGIAYSEFEPGRYYSVALIALGLRQRQSIDEVIGEDGAILG
ncbi:MAG: hypothetical protein IT159_06945 [Bryobacterales bacterium]|nr:hypothetical protein [Bryobacterales bacterium]